MRFSLQPARRILQLDASRLRVWSCHAETARIELECSPDESGQNALHQYLAACPPSLFYLLADVVEEDFRHETLPFVRGADRQALIARRLGQHFYGTPFTLAQSLGRDSDGRRDEHFLFSALTRPEFFTPWLDLLEAAGRPVAGLYSSSQLLCKLLPETVRETPRFMLITLGHGGLRQSYFENGTLHFSRLSPIIGEDLTTLSQQVGAETEKIHQYLIGQRLVVRGQSLPVFCLTDADDFSQLVSLLDENPELDFRHLPLQMAAPTSCAEGTDDSLVICLGGSRPANQFLPAGSRQHFRLWQVRIGLNLASMGSLLVAALFSAWMLASAFLDHQGRQESELQASAEQQHYQALLDTLPGIATTPEHLRSLAEAGRAMRPQLQSLAPELASLSGALEAFPNISLNQLAWRLTSNPSETAGSSSTPGLTARFILLEIEALLPAGISNDKRAQSEMIERFAATLKASHPGTEVRIVSRPFDTDSSKALKAHAEQQVAGALQFSLRMWHPLPEGAPAS